MRVALAVCNRHGRGIEARVRNLGASDKVTVIFPHLPLTGMRFDLIIVLRPGDEDSLRARQDYYCWVNEHLPTKLNKGGRLVDL